MVKCFRNCWSLCLGSILLSGALPSPASADWREGFGTFRIGIVSTDDTERVAENLEPFRLAIATALGVDVEFRIMRSYSALIDAQESARVEYAVLSSIAYAATWAKCKCIEPIAIPLAADQGKSVTAVVVSGEFGAGNISALGTENFIVPKSAAAGVTSYALHLLDQANLAGYSADMEAEKSIDHFLSNPQFSLLGWSSLVGDPSKGYSRGTLRAIAEKNGGDATGYRIIWKSPKIPNPPHAVLKSVPAEVKKIIRSTLRSIYDNDPVAYDSIEPDLGGGFGSIDHKSYAGLVDYVIEKSAVTAKSGVLPNKENSASN